VIDPPEPSLKTRLRAIFPVAPFKSSVFKDVSGLWIAEIVGLVAVAIQGVLVARWLGAHNLGVAALIMSYPAVVFTILDTSSGQATIKYLGEFKATDRPEAARAMCDFGYALDGSVALMAFAIVAATALWAEHAIVHSDGVAWLLVLFSAGYVARFPLATSEAILTTFRRFTTLGQIQAAVNVFRSVLVLVLVARGAGVPGVIWGNAIGLACHGALLWGLARPPAFREWGAARLRGAWARLGDSRTEIRRFLLYTDAGSLIALFVKQFDVVILGFFRGATEVGYYSLARSIASLGGNIVAPLQSVVYQRFTALWGSRDRYELRRSVNRYAFGVGLPLALAALVATLFVPEGLRLAVGRSFAPAGTAAQVLVAGSAVWVAFFWLRPLMLTLDEVRFWTLDTSVVSVLAVVAFVAFVPHFGFLAMAVIQTAVIVVAHVAGVLYLQRKRALAPLEAAAGSSLP
jgi:O-antigen/teichoic acid export membrane protein